MSPACARNRAFVVLTLLLSAGGLAAQGQAVFRAARELVRVYVTVTDQAGRLVTTLDREAFEIRDGRSQPIAAFDNRPTPIRIVVLLDISGSMNGTLPLLQKAADELFIRLRPDDLARVGYFGTRIWLGSPFTRDEAMLRAAVAGKDDAARTQGGGTALWGTLISAIELFDDAAPERPVILILSDGNNVDPWGKTTVADVIDRAQRSGVMIYSVGVPGQRGIAQPMVDLFNTSDARTPHPHLRRVADETGGGYLEVSKRDDLAVAFARVADELHSQYLLGYVPPKSDGKVHKIEVRLKASGMRVRARKTYVAPGSASSHSRPQ